MYKKILKWSPSTYLHFINVGWRRLNFLKEKLLNSICEKNAPAILNSDQPSIYLIYNLYQFTVSPPSQNSSHHQDQDSRAIWSPRTDFVPPITLQGGQGTNLSQSKSKEKAKIGCMMVWGWLKRTWKFESDGVLVPRVVIRYPVIWEKIKNKLIGKWMEHTHYHNNCNNSTKSCFSFGVDTSLRKGGIFGITGRCQKTGLDSPWKPWISTMETQ